MTYNIGSGANRWQMPDFLSDTLAIVMYALTLTVYEIFANQINCQNFDLENEGQGTRVESETCAIPLEMCT